MGTRRQFLGAVALAASGAGRAAATGLAAPRGEVLLVVDGAIAVTNAPGEARLDEALLESIGYTTLETATPWTEGVQRFEGVLGRRLLDALGANGTELEAVAVNDYRVTIPIADVRDYDVILARRMAGRELRLRDKGPLWIVYPWSHHPELDDRATRQKSVWYLTRLTVR